MEHRKKGRKLKRTASHRKALLSNLSVALILHKRIKTTLAKAKELRTYIEPLLTKSIKALGFQKSAPEKSIHLRRIARRLLNDKEAIRILFDEIAEKVKNRPGGYTRILKTGFRPGDAADEAIIEFVDYSIIKEKEAAQKKKEESKKTSEVKDAETAAPEETKPEEGKIKEETKKAKKPKKEEKGKTKKDKTEKPKLLKKLKPESKTTKEKPKKETKPVKSKKNKKED